jgi:integrase
MTTGLCRGEVCILRWSRVDLDVGRIEIRSSDQLRKGVGKEKDTKTRQIDEWHRCRPDGRLLSA